MSEAEEPANPDTEDEGVPTEEPESEAKTGQKKYDGGPIPRRASVSQPQSEEN